MDRGMTHSSAQTILSVTRRLFGLFVQYHRVVFRISRLIHPDLFFWTSFDTSAR